MGREELVERGLERGEPFAKASVGGGIDRGVLADVLVAEVGDLRRRETEVGEHRVKSRLPIMQ